jgi:hypothetical protein
MKSGDWTIKTSNAAPKTKSLLTDMGISAVVFVVYILLLPSSSHIGDYLNERLVYALPEQNDTNANNQSSSICRWT